MNLENKPQPGEINNDGLQEGGDFQADDLIEPIRHFLSETLKKESNADRNIEKDYSHLTDLHFAYNGSSKALEAIRDGKAKIEKIKLEKQQGKLIKIEVFIDTENSGYSLTVVQLMDKALKDFLKKNNLETNI
jgi:hypothetical protein